MTTPAAGPRWSGFGPRTMGRWVLVILLVAAAIVITIIGVWTSGHNATHWLAVAIICLAAAGLLQLVE